MRGMRKTTAALLVVGAFAVGAVPASAGQGEGPGNAGGQSGQCTGPQDDRPASCNSRGGPGDQGSN